MPETPEDHAAHVLREVRETTNHLTGLLDEAAAGEAGRPAGDERVDALATAPIQHYAEQLQTMIPTLRKEMEKLAADARPEYEGAAERAQEAVDRGRAL